MIARGVFDKPKFKYQTGNWHNLPRKRINNNPRVAWVLSGNEEVGSSRLKGTIIDRFVNENRSGFYSTIAYTQSKQDPRLRWKRREWLSFLKRTDILVTQSWAGSTTELLEDCQKMGIPAILTLSDLNVDSIPLNIYKLLNAIVVSSEKLQEEISRYHKKVYLIDDPLEVPLDMVRANTDNGQNPELVWMGHWMHWQEVEYINEILEDPEFSPLKFCTVTKHPEATHQWNLATRWQDISHSDLAVIPCRTDEWGISKSSNRLTTFLSLGYPVIASPIPSYKKFITHGVNGFFAETKENWKECIRLLRESSRRIQMGNAARETPGLKEITIDRVVAQWSDLFQQISKLDGKTLGDE